MEDQGQGRRNSRLAQGISQDAGYTLQQLPAQNIVLATPEERYRTAQSISSESTSRSIATSNAHLQYYQDSPVAFSATNMSEASIGFGSDYHPDTTEQTQGFGSYSTGMMMYNVPQASTQTSLYAGPPFGARSNAAGAQFPTTEITQPLFGSMGNMAAQELEDPAPTTLATAGAFHSAIPYFPYGSAASDLQSLLSQPEMLNMPEDTAERKAAELEEKWHDYQRQLGSVFEEITGGDLEKAADLLLAVSVWLLSQVTDLGLNEDDSRLHGDRLKLWSDFNNAWLSLIYKQKTYMTSGQRVTRVHQPLSRGTLTKMGDELIRLCDGIERHGLVDYQCGVWEDEIEALLEECLDLYDSSEGPD